MLVNDELDIGEMNSADSLDEDWSLDKEPTSQSEIESDDHGSSCRGLQVVIHSKRGTNVRGWGAGRFTVLMRGIQKTHGLSTGSRTIHGQLERGVRTRGSKLKRNELYDKSSRESDSSNAEEEDSANQGSVTSDNSKPPGDNPSSAGDKNPVNQGSDTIDNSNFADNNSSEVDESNGNSNWSSVDLVLKVFQFNENERTTIDVSTDDNSSFFSNLFVTDKLLNELVTRWNTYAKKVINSSRPLRRKNVLNTWKDVTVREIKQFLGLVLHMGLVAIPVLKSPDWL